MQASHPDGGVKYYYNYSYHYDWRCQWNVRYSGEPYYKGYLYKVWYKTTHTTVDYSNWQQGQGFRDYSYSSTKFSHRQYSLSYPRCSGGSY